MKVVKKHQIKSGRYQYILFDTERGVKRTTENTPRNILWLCNRYDIVRISEKQAYPLMRFKEVDINEFWELPF